MVKRNSYDNWSRDIILFFLGFCTVLILFSFAACRNSDDNPDCVTVSDDAGESQGGSSETPGTSSGALGEWVSLNGPPGGHFDILMQNPSPPYELYASSARGLFRSIDKGETWEPMSFSDDFHFVTSMEIHGNRLYVCGDGFGYFDTAGNFQKVIDGAFDALLIMDNSIFLAGLCPEITDCRILRGNLNDPEFGWTEMALPDASMIFGESPEKNQSPIPVHVVRMMGTPDRLIIHMVPEGFEENGAFQGVFQTLDGGKTWEPVSLDMPSGFFVTGFVTDPNDGNHLFILFQGQMNNDLSLPLSGLGRESTDGGQTWQHISVENIEARKISHVAFNGSSRFFVCPFNDLILEQTGETITRHTMPVTSDFPEIGFGLDFILFDGENPSIVYGKTDPIWSLGILKSTDGMQTWEKMDRDIPASSPTIVLPHPLDTNIIYTSGNVIQESYMTRDGGKTWEPFSPVAGGDEIAIDPHDPEHMLLADENTSLFESSDSGKTFTRIASHFSGIRIFDFAVSDSGAIYASNLGVGISKRTGDEWRYLRGSPDYAYTVTIDPDDENVLYASYSPKVFEHHASVFKYSPEISENDGWKEILRLENAAGISCLEFAPTDTNTLYTGVTGKKAMIQVSRDKGNTWEQLNRNFTFVTIHEMAVDSMGNVYAAPWGGGLFRSVDGGSTWDELKVPTVSISSIVTDPDDPNRIFIGDRTGPNIFLSRDGGASWETAVTLDPNDYYRITAMILHRGELYFSAFERTGGIMALFSSLPMSGGTFRLENDTPERLGGDIGRAVLRFTSSGTDLYAITHIQGVFHLDGNDWDDISMGLPDMGFNDIIVDQGRILLAGGCDLDTTGHHRVNDDTQVNEIYASSDNGNTWVPMLGNNPFHSPIKRLVARENGLMIAGTGNGVFVSYDNGENWTDENSGLPSRTIGAMAVSGEKIHAGTLGYGVFSGTLLSDGTISWNKSNGPYPFISNVRITCHPTNSDVIYATSYPGGVFKSTDAGKSWTECNFAMPSFKVDDPTTQGYYSLEIDPGSPETLYLGIYGKGVYKSYNGAASWFPMYGNFGQNADIMRLGITAVRVDPVNSERVYLASDSGVYLSEDGGEHWVSMNIDEEARDVRQLKVVRSGESGFTENFEDGNTDEWDMEAGWNITSENGNNFLKSNGHVWANTGASEWTNYEFSGRIRIIRGGVHANVRVSEKGRYAVGINEQRLYLFKQYDNWNSFSDNLATADGIQVNDWFDLRIEVSDATIRVFLNETLKLEYTDPDPLSNGAVAFESLDDSEILVDDVSVELRSQETLLYAGTAGYGMYFSSSAAGSWNPMGRTLGGGFWTPWERRMYQFVSFLFDPETPGKVYMGHFPGGFYISEDGGHSWKESCAGLGNDGIFSLSMDPEDPDILWAGTYNGVVKSENGGRTWVRKSNGMPGEQWPFTVAIDQNDPNIMYVSTKNGMNKGFCERNEFCGIVMKSTNGGESWFEIMNGLDPQTEFYKLLIHPENSQTLYLSTNNGVFSSTNAGNSWEPMNDGLPRLFNQVRDNVADNLAFTADHQELILGLTDYGVWKMDLPIP